MIFKAININKWRHINNRCRKARAITKEGAGVGLLEGVNDGSLEGSFEGVWIKLTEVEKQVKTHH